MDTLTQINELSVKLREVRQKTNEAKEAYESHRRERDTLQAEIMGLMGDNKLRSYKNDIYSISIATRKSLVVADEKAFIAELNERGVLKSFLKVDTTRALDAVKGEYKEKGEFPGVDKQEREYISVREAK